MMVQSNFVLLDGRGILAVSGPDRLIFLQGLVSNDVEKIAPDRAVYAALLTAQGKYLHDFIMAAAGDAIWLDAEAARLADLKRRLSMYRLRAKVAIDELPDVALAAVFGDGAHQIPRPDQKAPVSGADRRPRAAGHGSGARGKGCGRNAVEPGRSRPRSATARCHRRRPAAFGGWHNAHSDPTGLDAGRGGAGAIEPLPARLLELLLEVAILLRAGADALAVERALLAEQIAAIGLHLLLIDRRGRGRRRNGRRGPAEGLMQ